MRAELRRILDAYEDFELAFLWKYKLDTYLPDTQDSIQHYIKTERRLSTTTLEALITEYSGKEWNDGIQRCPRCKSGKIIATDEAYWRSGDQGGFYEQITALDSISGRTRNVRKLVCAVCDYVIQDLNNDVGSPWDHFKKLILRSLFRKQ